MKGEMNMDQNLIDKKITEFMDNVQKNGTIKDISQHNVYYIYKEDMDGNVTGEAYGVNLVTQNGLKLFVGGYESSSTYSSGTYILMGSGQTAPSITDTGLTTLVLTSSKIYRDGTIGSWTYWYDTTRHVLCARCRFVYATYDYTYMGTAEGQDSVDLYEVGIKMGNYYGDYDTQSLATHSLIYDKDGNQTYITKTNTERMTVHVYLTLSVAVSMFNTHYNNGEYVCMHPQRMTNGYWGSIYQKIGADYYLWTKNNRWIIYATSAYPHMSDSATLDSNNRVNPHYDNSGWSGTWTDKHHYISKIYEGRDIDVWPQYVSSGNENTNFDIYSYIKNPDGPEQIECYDMWTNSDNSNNINRRFGMWWKIYDDYGNRVGGSSDNWSWMVNTEGRWYRDHVGCLPVTDFHMTGCYMYNHQTKEWDIDETLKIHDAPYADYSRYFWLGKYMVLPRPEGAHDPNDSVNNEYYIYINPKNNVLPPFNQNPSMPDHIPIKKMKLGVSRNIYATDEWWDPSTFEIIPDLNNIPQSLGTKKYYLSYGGHAGFISDERDQDVHAINCGGPYYNIQTVEPANWSTNYTDYYTKSGSTYTQVPEGASAPTFIPNTYYLKTDSSEQVVPDQRCTVEVDLCEFAYELLLEEPADFTTDYTKYYTRSGSPGAYTYTQLTQAETFAANTFYQSAWEKGRFASGSPYDGSNVNDNSWVRLRGYVRLPINLQQVSSMTITNSLNVHMQFVFFDKKGQSFSYYDYTSRAQLTRYDVSSGTKIEYDIESNSKIGPVAYVRVALLTTTIPTENTHVVFSFEKNYFSGRYNNRGKLLRSNTNNWIALTDRIIYPEAVGGLVSFPLASHPQTAYITPTVQDDVNDKFIPEVVCGILRWNTEDRLIIPDVSECFILRNTSSSDYSPGLWSYNNQIRIFTVTSTLEAPSYVDVTLNFTNWNNDNTDSYSRSRFFCNKRWGFSKVDNTHAYLFAYNAYSSSQSYLELVYVKIYDLDENNIPTQGKLTGVVDPYLIEGTPYICYKIANTSPDRFAIYNMETEETIAFDIPIGYTFVSNTINGVGNYMYFTAKDSGSNFTTFMVDITDSNSQPKDLNKKFASMYHSWDQTFDRNFVYLYTNMMSASYIGVGDRGYFPALPIQYNNILVLPASDCRSYMSKNDNYGRSDMRIIIGDEPEDDFYLFAGNDININRYGRYTNSEYISHSASYISMIDGQIQESADGKHLLLVSSSMVYREGDHGGKPIVIDLGASIDYNTPNSRWEYLPNIQVAESYFGITEFHNMIYTLKKTGQLDRRELGRFLPHKVVGTTYTITSYMNPKHIDGSTSLQFTIGIEAVEDS